MLLLAFRRSSLGSFCLEAAWRRLPPELELDFMRVFLCSDLWIKNFGIRCIMIGIQIHQYHELKEKFWNFFPCDSVRRRYLEKVCVYVCVCEWERGGEREREEIMCVHRRRRLAERTENGNRRRRIEKMVCQVGSTPFLAHCVWKIINK